MPHAGTDSCQVQKYHIGYIVVLKAVFDVLGERRRVDAAVELDAEQ